MMKMKVLLVDDFRIANEVLIHRLTLCNFDVFSTQNPEDAISKIEAEKFDLIITDFLMPIMNGIELTQAIRKLPAYSTTPVIIVSGVKNSKFKQLAIDSNVTAWIEKPINYEKIEQIINFLNRLAL